MVGLQGEGKEKQSEYCKILVNKPVKLGYKRQGWEEDGVTLKWNISLWYSLLGCKTPTTSIKNLQIDVLFTTILHENRRFLETMVFLSIFPLQIHQIVLFPCFSMNFCDWSQNQYEEFQEESRFPFLDVFCQSWTSPLMSTPQTFIDCNLLLTHQSHHYCIKVYA